MGLPSVLAALTSLLHQVQLLCERYLPELERTKQLLQKREAAGLLAPPPSQDEPGAQQLSTSYLPELHNWNALDARSLPGSLTHSATSMNGGYDLLSNGQLGNLQHSEPMLPQLPSFDTATLRLPVASQAARSRHALMSSAQPARRAPASQLGPLYPQLNATPLPPIDYGLAQLRMEDPAPMPAAIPDAGLYNMQHSQPTSLLDADQAPSAPSLPPADALEEMALHLQPQLELQLGPQELQVQPEPHLSHGCLVL